MTPQDGWVTWIVLKEESKKKLLTVSIALVSLFVSTPSDVRRDWKCKRKPPPSSSQYTRANSFSCLLVIETSTRVMTGKREVFKYIHLRVLFQPARKVSCLVLMSFLVNCDETRTLKQGVCFAASSDWICVSNFFLCYKFRGMKREIPLILPM